MRPVRKIPLQSRSIRGFYMSTRWKRPIAHESNLERDFLILCDFDPKVRSVTEQPCQIAFTSDDLKNRNYTPDFFVEPECGVTQPILVEIKFKEELERHGEQYAAKFDAALAFAMARGWDFGVRTEEDIRTVRLKNAKFLLPYLRQPPDHGLAARWMNSLHRNESFVVANALKDLWGEGEESLRALSALWHLVASGKISADVDAMPLGLHSEVWVNG